MKVSPKVVFIVNLFLVLTISFIIGLADAEKVYAPLIVMIAFSVGCLAGPLGSIILSWLAIVGLLII